MTVVATATVTARHAFKVIHRSVHAFKSTLKKNTRECQKQNNVREDRNERMKDHCVKYLNIF
jgi:hypothetical protein